MTDQVEKITKTKSQPVIMVVDDEEMVTRTIASYLELETDYEVLTFQSPFEALEALKRKHVDLIVSDFLMPDMDGLAFLAEVKKRDPHIVSILLTGYADKENAIKAINEIGIFQYLEKPWDNDRLKLVIRNGLDNKNLRDVLEDKIRELDDVLLERDELSLSNKLMQAELELASNVQLSLLPQQFPSQNGIVISAMYQPALKIGGDFYDVIYLTENKIALLIADVTGHGVQAALITTTLKSSFAAFKGTDVSAQQILREMNATLHGILPLNLYVAGMIAVLDMATGEGHLANAGIPHPLLLCPATDTSEIIPANGLLLGITENNVFRPGEEVGFQLKPGEKLLMYTDGLTEAPNEEDEFFEFQVARTALEKNNASLDEMLEHVIATARSFTREEHHWDDLTILGIAYASR